MHKLDFHLSSVATKHQSFFTRVTLGNRILFADSEIEFKHLVESSLAVGMSRRRRKPFSMAICLLLQEALQLPAPWDMCKTKEEENPHSK